MAPYRITLLDREGSEVAEHRLEFNDDDAAIDHAGGIAHPHAIDLWQGDRHVARFPPWSGPMSNDSG